MPGGGICLRRGHPRVKCPETPASELSEHNSQRTTGTKALRAGELGTFEEWKEGQRSLRCLKPTRSNIKPTRDSYM